MQDNFEKCLSLVLVHEGGYADHPHDPGGATMKGVTQRVYDAYRRNHGLDPQPVRQITDREVQQIYKRQYWDRVCGDWLPAGLDYVAFDAAVNSGVSRGAKWLQQALGVRPDGIVGEKTLEAAKACDPEDAINRACDARLRFVRSLRTWKYFGKGWSRRIAGVRRQAVYMAGAAEPLIAPLGEPMAKAEESDIAATAVMKDKAVGSEGLMVGGGIGAGIADMSQSLLPFADYSNVIRWVFIGLLLAGLAFTIIKYVKKYRRGELQL